ncbi:MAG TPA: hypothetical protein DCG54_02155 [Anaerolineae bacterium]|nr:hypothetical protein [Anaerolineae bacterium]
MSINFSMMMHNNELAGHLEEIFLSYKQQMGIQATKRELTYEQGRSEFVNNAIYGGVFDVSEMGSTWINDFIAMGALRPCQEFAENVVGNLDNYPPALFTACSDEQGLLYAVPWMTDVSMVYYRRDLFQKAGIKEEGAFSSPERFDETLAALADAGVVAPWAMPTVRSFVSIHELFIWLQASGYSYLDSTGRRVILAESGPRQVLRAYLSLHKYLAPDQKRLRSDDADRLFMTGQAAVRISGPWLLRYCEPEVRENLGLAIPMNRTYLGGAGLVVWNSSREVLKSVELIKKLTDREASIKIAYLAGLMPARLDCIAGLPDEYVRPEYRPMIETAIRGGVSIPKTPLGGMVEDRLVTMIDMLWQRFFESQTGDIDQFLEDELDTVVNRLNMVLSNYYSG